VGRLKFKRAVRCLPLPQHGVTYRLIGKGKVKIVGIQKPLRVRGLDRIPEGAEVSSARLLKKPSGYSLHVVCWLNKEAIPRREPIGDAIGVDFGVAHQITLSNGMKIKWQVGESGRLKGLQRKLARQEKESANYRKTKGKIEKEHEHLGNIRRDIGRKVVSYLRGYKAVCYQAEQFQGWSRWWGKRMGRSGLAGITSSLGLHTRYDGLVTAVVLPRYAPTTQCCSGCGYQLLREERLRLCERQFRCPRCGMEMDRDVNAARNMVRIGLCLTDPPAGTVGVTPVERTTAGVTIGSNPYVTLSCLCEAGIA
jgi:transposase